MPELEFEGVICVKFVLRLVEDPNAWVSKCLSPPRV